MLTLTGVNTYSGQTIVEGGTLNVTRHIGTSPVELDGGQRAGQRHRDLGGNHGGGHLVLQRPESIRRFIGDSVEFTAAVGTTNGGFGTPTGWVDFYDEATGLIRSR